MSGKNTPIPITLEKCPDFIAVVDGRSDLQKAFYEAAINIIRPEIRAVVIKRNVSNGAIKDFRSVTPWHEEELSRDITGVKTDLDQVSAEVGIEFALLAEQINESFPPVDFTKIHWYREGLHRAYSQIHLDPEFRRSLSRPDISVTSSLFGGGTIIHDIPDECLLWEDSPKEHGWKAVGLENLDINMFDSYIADNGDIVILKGCGHPETHKPCFHSGSETKEKEERAVLISVASSPMLT